MNSTRKQQSWLNLCCYHISNRCDNGLQIFKFSKARDHALGCLRQIQQKRDVKILNYQIMPEGYRLLLATSEPSKVSKALQLFHAATNKNFSAGKRREGAVWKGSGNITLVQKGPQAIRCSLDMDFAMLQDSNKKVYHPLLWKHSGHLELAEVRKRYRIIDRDALKEWFLNVPWQRFQEWYLVAANLKWDNGDYTPEKWWDDAFLVGEKELCEHVADTLPESWRSLKAYPPLTSIPELLNSFAWTLNVARSQKRSILYSYAPT